MASSSERLRLLQSWLKDSAGLKDYSLAPASNDASFRRYFRIIAGERSYIAMDAPPDREDCRPFVHVAALLRSAGLHAPQVLAQDFFRGFLLLDDLGKETYLDVLTSDNADALFEDAIAALLRWQLASRPDTLPSYGQALLHRELDLFAQWYLPRRLGVTLGDAEQAEWETIRALLTGSALTQPQVYVHRDYMPRNLMVSDPNPGVLDFQDAVYGPITYDVVSLFKDAFLSWPQERIEAWVRRYWERARAEKLPVQPDWQEFRRAFDWMGLQRHLKVLGIFARLTYRDGKARYVADTPRFVRYIMDVAPRYSELHSLTALFERHVLPKIFSSLPLDGGRGEPMRAMILAAGRGTRLRPLTDHTPKPLIEVGCKPLIAWHLENLAKAGFREVVINLAHLAARIRGALGEDRASGLKIHYSEEGDNALETGGGIFKALPLLGEKPFLVINGDIWCDYPLKPIAIADRDLAHLVLVDGHAGDFHLENGRVTNAGMPLLTFSGIGCYRPELFADCRAGGFPLAPLLRRAADEGRISGEYYSGNWFDAGTPERLCALDDWLRNHRRSADEAKKIV